ncbi:enediyne antibiotic chromoprotein [Streptomyces triculaminicus]|uniref:enediyne antibiotic chromoprotein n=1 Tax=Streptomyces triculaminicus TaxID=2816232 RepID=UPI0033D1CFB2
MVNFRTGPLPGLGAAAALALGLCVAAQAPALAVQAAQITVTPSENLNDGQSVTVSVSGAQPGAEYFVGQCAKVNGADACNWGSATPYRTDDKGAATFQLVVNKAFQGKSPTTGEVVGPVDCAAVQCYVDSGGPNEHIGQVRLSFAG